jgi:hypothetical protein
MSKTNGHEDRCANCRFWLRSEKGQPTGMCRADTPKVFFLGLMPHPVMKDQAVPMMQTYWPNTPEHMWCGAHQRPLAAFSAIDLNKLEGVSRA